MLDVNRDFQSPHSGVVAQMAQEHLKSPPPSLSRALGYIDMGWAPVPIPFKSKAPVLRGWPELRIGHEDAVKHFGHQERNIGVILGDASGNLTDVDLDCPEAVRLAPQFLPPSSTFGRASKPESHWLYVCEGIRTTHFKDVDGSMLVEIRSTGSQTVFPGSVHESGEPIEWAIQSHPVTLSADDLRSHAGRLAAAALLVSHYPAEGSRNDSALALAGALLRNGIDNKDAASFIRTVAEAAGDEEAEQRADCVTHTHAKLNRGEPVTGLPRLAELVGSEVVDRLVQWLALDRATVHSWVDEMNERYCVVNDAGTTLVYEYRYDESLKRETLVKLKFDDLRKLYLNDIVQIGLRTDGTPHLVDKATAWLKHKDRRTYAQVVFAPGQRVPEGTLNLWRGFSVKPVQGDWRKLQAHILNVICSCNRQHYEYLVKWLARAVQYPGEPGGIAVVLRGGRGTGKGTLGNALLKIFGPHGMYVSNGRHLTGHFNAHLREAVLVFCDEAFFAGDRSQESVLKALVTEPHLTIEAKHQNAIMAPNCTHILMASNERWVVPAGTDERRFFVLDVADTHKQDSEYFRALREEMDNGGLAAFLEHLLSLDITGFDVFAVPKTAALAEQKLLSLRGTEKWLLDRLHQEAIGEAIWSDNGLSADKRRAYEDYVQWAKDNREYAPESAAQWAKTIHRALPGCVRERRPRSDGNLLNRPRVLMFRPIAECRAAFERSLSVSIDWGDTDVEVDVQAPLPADNSATTLAPSPSGPVTGSYAAD